MPPIDPSTYRHHLINSQGQVQLSDVPTKIAIEMISESLTSDPPEVLYRVYANEEPLTLALQLLDEIAESIRGENDLTYGEMHARSLYIGELNSMSTFEVGVWLGRATRYMRETQGKLDT